MMGCEGLRGMGMAGMRPEAVVKWHRGGNVVQEGGRNLAVKIYIVHGRKCPCKGAQEAIYRLFDLPPARRLASLYQHRE